MARPGRGQSVAYDLMTPHPPKKTRGGAKWKQNAASIETNMLESCRGATGEEPTGVRADKWRPTDKGKQLIGNKVLRISPRPYM